VGFSRSQPHVYIELNRYGLHKNLKPTVSMMNPEASTHSFSSSPEVVDPEETFNTVDRVTRQFLSVDGETSRTLMPYPHDPQRAPRLWAKYDNLTMTQRLDQMNTPKRDRALFETYLGLCGLGKPDDIGFTEVLRWYALAGHNMAAMYEQTSVYKLGKGGMTSFAKALLDEVHADRLMNTEVNELSQANGKVYVQTKAGHRFTADTVISTIPL
jgi:phytoene dehydrogenase-like protein